MSNIINGKEYPLAKIFSSDFEFKIPPYQRPYAWTENEVTELFEDLLSFSQENQDEDYFLGSIVLIKDEKYPYSEVIDGQQRLTSLCILLAAIAASSDEEDKKDYLSYIMEPGKKSMGLEAKPRLTLRDMDKDFFREYIQELHFEALCSLTKSQLKTEAQEHIQKNSKVFMDKIKEKFADNKEKLLNFGSFVVQHCYFVVVSSPSSQSAFRVFSVLNNRGLDLLPCDIIKADIIGKIPQDKQEKYTTLWENIENQTGRDNFNELFGHIRMIAAKQKQQKTLLEEFRVFVLGDNMNSESIIDNIIQPYADAYRILTRCDFQSSEDATPINRLLRWLNKIDNNDWLPPAILFFSKHHQYKECLDFLTKLERLAAVMHICANNVNYRISRYAQIIEDITIGKDLSNLELLPSETSLMFNLLNGDVYTELTSVRRNYLLLRLDSFVSDGSAQYSPATLTIEHVLPQQPAVDSAWIRDWPNQAKRQEWTHRLANLVPLPRAKNSEAQNYDFDVKKEKYFTGSKGTSSYALTSQVLNESEWTEKVLVKRQKMLLDTLKNKWNFDDNFGNPIMDTLAKTDYKNKAKKLTFELLGIPVGSELTFFKKQSVKCIVKDKENTVSYDGQEYALSTLALKLLHECGFKWKTARGADHFLYKGMKLSDMPHAK